MLFFKENRGSVDTARGISTWTSENIHKVRRALEDLVKNGLLEADRTPSTVGYSCTLTEKELSSLVTGFIP